MTGKEKELDHLDSHFGYKIPEEVLRDLRKLKVSSLRVLNTLVKEGVKALWLTSGIPAMTGPRCNFWKNDQKREFDDRENPPPPHVVAWRKKQDEEDPPCGKCEACNEWLSDTEPKETSS